MLKRAMAATTIKGLETCISDEILLGEKLLALLEQKRKSVIKNDIELIESLTQDENDALHQLEEVGLEPRDILAISKQPGYRITKN